MKAKTEISVEYKTAYFLKLSGALPLNKQNEFEQTFRFVSNQLPADCLQCTLTVDVSDPHRYHFYALWPSAESLDKFLHSSEFQLLEGAFQTLGSIEQRRIGEKEVSIQLFHWRKDE